MHLSYQNFVLLLGCCRCVLGARPTASTPEQQVILPSSIGKSTSVHDALKYSSIIYDVLDDFQPTYSLSVTYPKSHEFVHLGNDLPVVAVSSRPAFGFHAVSAKEGASVSSNKTFTLILTDPDAKSRDDPKWSEMCHWIVTNLTTPATSEFAVSKEGELVEYLPPTPPPKTGKHRYVFVLLEDEKGQSLSAPKDRKHWGYGKVRHGVRDWAEEHKLKVVGANFFYAQDEKQ